MHAEETTPAYWCSATAHVSMRTQMRNDTTVAQMWSEAAIRQACTDQRFGTTTRAAVLQYLHHASVVFAQLCVLPLVLDQRAGLVPLDSCGVGGDYLDRNAPRWCSAPPVDWLPRAQIAGALAQPMWRFVHSCAGFAQVPSRALELVWSEAVMRHLTFAIPGELEIMCISDIARVFWRLGMRFDKQSKRILLRLADYGAGRVVVPRVCCVLSQTSDEDSCPMCPQRTAEERVEQTHMWVSTLPQTVARRVLSVVHVDAACTKGETNGPSRSR